MPAVDTATHTHGHFLARIHKKYPHASLYISRRPHATTVLCVQPDRCRLIFFEEATPDQIEAVFAQAKANGITAAPHTILLDFSSFTGSIDWTYIKNQSSLTPGLEGFSKKAAYVLKSKEAVRVADAIVLWRRHIECRTFLDLADAETWLGWI